MSAVPVAPQALQDPDTEPIESPPVNRELKSGRILHQACAHCPLGWKHTRRVDLVHLVYSVFCWRTFLASCYRMNREMPG